MENVNAVGTNYQNIGFSERENYMSLRINDVKGENTGNTGRVGNASNPSAEKKKQYLELAVSQREKELEKLGLRRNEDGTVTMKPTGKTENGPEEKIKKRTGLEECETCANRKYQDGSDEMVSFKSASHIAPEAAATAVRAHEGEHVSNAYDKAEKYGGEVVNASVAIHTSICPECGRVYVSGGTTTTTIRYNSDKYASNAKMQDASIIPGKDVDTGV